MARRGISPRERARRHLRQILSTVDGPQLPSIHSLAYRAGVSYVTMWKALREAEAHGVVEGRQGAGYRVAAGPPARCSAAAVPSRRRSWERAMDGIRRRILDGRFAAGTELPTNKELQAELGATYRAVRAALERLHADRVLARTDGGYRVPSVAAARPASRIMLTVFGEAPMKPLPISERSRELFRAAERECARRNVHLDVTTCVGGFPEGVRLFDRPTGEPVTISPDDHYLGFLFLAVHDVRYNALLLHLLRRQRKPVAVMRDFEHEAFGERRFWPAPVRLFDVARDDAPGWAVGRFLLELGHRRVAYIDDSDGAPWSLRRRDGMKRVFVSHGLRDAVETVTMAPAAASANREATRTGTAMVEQMRRLAESSPFSAEFALQQVELTLGTLAFTDVLLRRLAPCVDALLGRPEVTAWVCSRDAVALAVLDHVRHCRRAVVPSRVSLLGFDDSRAAFEANLTSYSFNVQGVAAAMVDHVLQPQRVRARLRGEPAAVDGFVVKRGSTARTLNSVGAK